jgi:hypothetical protein
VVCVVQSLVFYVVFDDHCLSFVFLILFTVFVIPSSVYPLYVFKLSFSNPNALQSGGSVV